MQKIGEQEKMPLLFEAEIINVENEKINTFKKDIYLKFNFYEIHKLLKEDNFSDDKINNIISKKYLFFGLCVKYTKLLKIIGKVDVETILNDHNLQNSYYIVEKIRNKHIAHFLLDGKKTLKNINIGFNTDHKITPFVEDEYFYLDSSIVNTLSNLCVYFCEYYSDRVTRFITENEKNIIKKDIFIKY